MLCRPNIIPAEAVGMYPCSVTLSFDISMLSSVYGTQFAMAQLIPRDPNIMMVPLTEDMKSVVKRQSEIKA
jgi:hypothetical protein